MASDAHILISLAERHADNIFSGSKQVELRRRIMHVEPGTTAWIYVKLPIGSIVGRVQVVSVYSSSPKNIWRRFGAVSGLTKSEFFGYFDGIEQGFALVLEDAVRLDNYLSLSTLREIYDSFHPPQFFLRLTSQNPVLGLIKRL